MISQRQFRFVTILVVTLGFILILTWQAASAGDNGGNALNFGGAAHVVIPEGSSIDNLGTINFTLEAWVYPRPRGGDLSIIRDHHDYSLYLNDARHLVAYVYPDGDRQEDPWVRAESTAPVANDQWHHVASVWDGSAIQLYVDGNPARYYDDNRARVRFNGDDVDWRQRVCSWSGIRWRRSTRCGFGTWPEQPPTFDRRCSGN